jgi:hypothetical protein
LSVISSTERFGTSSSTSGSPVAAERRRRSLASSCRRWSSAESGRTGVTGEGVGRGCCCWPCARVPVELPLIEAFASPRSVVVVVGCAAASALSTKVKTAPSRNSFFIVSSEKVSGRLDGAEDIFDFRWAIFELRTDGVVIIIKSKVAHLESKMSSA